MGLSSRHARSSAAVLHGYHSTGLCACCTRLGLVSSARALRKALSVLMSLYCGMLTSSIAREGGPRRDQDEGRKSIGQVNTSGSTALAPNRISFTRATSLRIKSSSLISLDTTLHSLTSPDGAMMISSTTLPCKLVARVKLYQFGAKAVDPAVFTWPIEFLPSS